MSYTIKYESLRGLIYMYNITCELKMYSKPSKAEIIELRNLISSLDTINLMECRKICFNVGNMRVTVVFFIAI